LRLISDSKIVTNSLSSSSECHINLFILFLEVAATSIISAHSEDYITTLFFPNQILLRGKKIFENTFGIFSLQDILSQRIPKPSKILKKPIRRCHGCGRFLVGRGIGCPGRVFSACFPGLSFFFPHWRQKFLLTDSGVLQSMQKCIG